MSLKSILAFDLQVLEHVLMAAPKIVEHSLIQRGERDGGYCLCGFGENPACSPEALQLHFYTTQGAGHKWIYPEKPKKEDDGDGAV